MDEPSAPIIIEETTMNGHLPTEPRLRARAIGKTFGGTVALRGVDLDVMRGEMLALVGANGAGKSTLVKIICGAYNTDDGDLQVDGRPVAFASVGDALAAGIAVAHQQVAIIPTLTAAENIMLGQEPRRFGLIQNGRLNAEARALAERFGVDIPLDRECGDLGIGENKILDILKALKSDPALLILDEPTASLTLNESRKLFGFLRDLKANGLAILFISHHINEIFENCDRVAVLKDGIKVHDGAVNDTTPDAVIRLMVGRAIEDGDWVSHAVAGKVSVRLTDVTIGSLQVPDLTVHRGEVVGIAGVLGAGQTDLIEAMAGGRPTPGGGQIALNGLERLPRNVDEATEQGIYLIADNRLKKALFPGLTIEENLMTGSLDHVSRFGFMRDRETLASAEHVIDQLGVKCSGPAQDILQLSGGNQQKVAFGRWLVRMARGPAAVPPLLLLDNPTEGVDVGSKAELYALIRGFAKQGASVVIASAEFGELLKLCDRIYCITDDRLSSCLDRADFSEERLLLEVN
ncbi:sugar ABC transporter ATP-binding protein [Lichenihabitans psoromatis]|uniref:sugar ABC transporter ATP-binding protein n=1 Tax=Lichenihabitans psoromatis TaxID=2528642 RepID=UPI0010385BC1|nr:sugar ABC transporter ATP-binding protein [Lichenihabitans psoromatis]